jgi:site-specific DNA-cytosine methylase
VIARMMPRLVIMENVKTLTRKRALDDGEAPTDIIVQDLANLGYAARHCLLDSMDFGLPQRRVRVYVVALRGDCDVAPVFRNVAQMRVRPLALSASSVLERSIAEIPVWPHASLVSRRNRGKTWRELELPFLEQHAEFFGRDLPKAMLQELRSILHFRRLTERAQRVLAIMYCVALRVHRVDPRLTLCVFDCSQSLGRVPWEVEASPCVCPGSILWVSCCAAGPHAATAAECLRLQGISDYEALLHNLAQVKPTLLRDLAGNAFAAHVIGAVLLAALAHISG